MPQYTLINLFLGNNMWDWTKETAIQWFSDIKVLVNAAFDGDSYPAFSYIIISMVGATFVTSLLALVLKEGVLFNVLLVPSQLWVNCMLAKSFAETYVKEKGKKDEDS